MPQATDHVAHRCVSSRSFAKQRLFATLFLALAPLLFASSDGGAQVRAGKAEAPAIVAVAPMAVQAAVVPQATAATPGSTGTPASGTAQVVVASASSPAITPVSPAWTDTLNKIVPDPPPPHLVRGTHYVISNEDRHDLWLKTVQGKGGAYLGVGTDQNYVLAGWQKPELMVLFDFDQVVVNLHYVYRVFFISAGTIDEFKSLWEVKNEATAMKLLTDAYPHPKQRAAVVEAYKMSRGSVLARFRKVLGIYKVHNIRCFLDDQSQYDHLAQLFRTGRVVMVRGDLTVGGSLSSIASALQGIGVKLSVLYLSNAERYWTYTDGFRKSITALPFGDDATVIRTRARPNGVYMYVVQDAKNFLEWVRHPKVNTVYQVTHNMDPDPNPGLYYIRKSPAIAVPSVPHPPFAHLKAN
ncbi:MAG TPA: hypothetical protein PK472_03785 [Pseudomonadota bacterium]|nr:hypothetical protein [Pseudomonadota bacterium]